MVTNPMAPTPIKLVRAALEVPTVKVAQPQGGGGGVDDAWSQLQLINPSDTGDVMDSATAEHESMQMFEIHFWYHQFALVLGGEMVVQDLNTGEVYRGHEGDLFHWAPGLTVQFGGRFRALGTKTPVPMRWVQTPSGKKEVLMHTLADEILLPGAEPDEIRDIGSNAPRSRRRMKFVRGATGAELVKVDSPATPSEDWWQVALVDPFDTDLVGSACIEEHRGRARIVRDHRWHEVALILAGDLTTENLDTGETFRAREGDLFYWGPGLRQSLEGEFRVLSVKTPEPHAWMTGGEVDARALAEELRCPGTPPDEVVAEPLREA